MAGRGRDGALSALARRIEASGASLARAIIIGAIGLVLAVVSLGSGVFASKALYIERDGDQVLLDAVERSSDGGDEVPVAEESHDVVVDVSGAVANPSVVVLSEGARVQDAIDAAGGLTDDADIAAVNRAALVSDGAKIIVPRVGESAPASSTDAPEGTGGASATLVNINTASSEELDALPGVGPSTAAAIIEDREANGPFTAPEDLMRVSGIGEKKYAKLEGLICV